MRSLFVLSSIVVLVLALVPGWSGEERLALLGRRPQIDATRVVFDRSDPQARRTGQLTFLGGIALTSRDPAFGGFSSLAVQGDRFTLLSDGGNVVAFRMGADWRPHDLSFADLPGGPGRGFEKRDRDSESMSVDPVTGQAWVGFEGSDMIWRYSPGFARAERGSAPDAMRRWPANGGAESLVRLRDGRFVVLSESARPVGGGRGREGLVFARDPTRDTRVAFRFIYMPTRGYAPADMAELPDGRIVVLERGFALPFSWSNRIMLVERAAIRPGAVVRGTLLGTLAAPRIHDNFEGIAAVREGDATMLWLVSDDNRLWVQRSLLLKFRLD